MASHDSDGYPRVGSMAPEFSLVGTGDGEVRLADCRGRVVVLFFYPRDMTSGCTKEACGFRDHVEDFRKLGVVVFGISPDPLVQHEKFIEKHALNFPLLADEDRAVAKAYGVWRLRSRQGQEYMGIARTTFVIAQNGQVAKVFSGVQPTGHADEVKAWIEKYLPLNRET